MLTKASIKNFKSIKELEIELGRINVFIGENGCGKSNLLEAFAFASAAYEGKLGREFLATRGVRVTEPAFMRAAFEKQATTEDISLRLEKGTKSFDFSVSHPNDEYSPWILQSEIEKFLQEWLNSAQGSNPDWLHFEVPSADSFSESDTKDFGHLKIDKDKLYNIFQEVSKKIAKKKEKTITDFMIYSPDFESLRNFEKENQVEPLGIHGEGLFKLLYYLKDEGRLPEIKKRLELIDWFDDFELATDRGKKIRIRDRYLDEDMEWFDQRSSNEGFLFLLFYYALFLAKVTPTFFAIDNIDVSFNPKLCSRLITDLAEIAKENDKQALFTTHNPAILDGLNLHDEAQRLFLVYRNADGHTNVRRIPPPRVEKGQVPLRLSEAFLRGYLGGLPQSF